MFKNKCNHIVGFCFFILIVIGFVVYFFNPDFFMIARDAKALNLNKTKTTLENAFNSFSYQTRLPSSNIIKCSHPFQVGLDCITLNGIEIAFTKNDRKPILNPYDRMSEQLMTIVDLDVSSSDSGSYLSDLNIESDYDKAAMSNGFWIFSSFDGGYKDINNLRCKIYYIPENHTLNRVNVSYFAIETDDCSL